MQSREESLVITQRQLSTLDVRIRLFLDAFEALPGLGRRPTRSGTNALLLSKRRCLFIELTL
jgi:hypothetical protein